jgi:Ser/Thr protein kinase RdoA (MazF antagonist)
MARLDRLAAFTEVPGQLTRRYLSPAHLDAIGQVKAWMKDAGMSVRTDPLLSLYGRYEGRSVGARDHDRLPPRHRHRRRPL